MSGSSRAALSAECTDPELVVASQTLSLWPPNHKFHEVAVGDCVSAIDSCGGELDGEFIWASSDEPVDSIGDGHHAPDIGLGIDTAHACVRSERQGPKDGRVYKLGVRIVAADGEEVERECVIVVDHDQRGVVATDSSEAYRIELDPSTAGLDCEGNPGEGGVGGGGGAAGEAGEGGVGGEGGEGGAAGEAGEGGVGGEGGAAGEAGEGGQGGECAECGGTGGTAGDPGTAGEGGSTGEEPPIEGPI